MPTRFSSLAALHRPSTPPECLPLCVPPWDTAEALDAGAKYTDQKGFHVEADAFLGNLWKWLPRMYDPDRQKPILMPEMLPVTTWEQNIRHNMGPAVWDRLRRHAYKAAGFRCEVCGDPGKLEAHEAWRLINETSVQKLERILALCPLCHKAHHLGIARRLGMLPDVRQQLNRVNCWSDAQTAAAIQDAYETWEQRCEWPWTVDLSWLYDSGYIYV